MSSATPGTAGVPQPVDDLVSRLERLDVCAVSDALDALSMPSAVLGLVPMWEGARLVGPARTVKLAEGPAPPGSPPVHLGARAIEASDRGDVVVVDNGGRTGMGGWGGLLALAASVKGVAGVIVDGACRDIDEARELRFPAFARTPVARTARGRVHEQSSGQPVSLGRVHVVPGDLVMADGSGVVIVPKGRAEQVIARAEQIVAREELMQADLRAGRPVSQVLGSSYEEMLAR
jgi:4-hydroxy-4-methyl-2-oxoglutarate aldolase